MTGVEADAYPCFVIDPFNDIGELLEGIPQVGALTRRVLQHRGNSCCCLERKVDRVGDGLQALLLMDYSKVAAGMEVEKCQSEGLGTLHFVRKRPAGPVEFFRIGTAQVDQVAVVGQNMFGPVVAAFAVFPESLYVFFRQCRCCPLTLIFGEHGKRCRPYLFCTERGVFYSSGYADMCPCVTHMYLLNCWIVGPLRVNGIGC